MGLVTKEILLDKLSKKYPEFTRASLKELVDYGNRRLIHLLNNGNDVLLNGNTKNIYDGVLFCEDVSHAEHIKQMKSRKEKMLNRIRVKRFLKNKNNG